MWAMLGVALAINGGCSSASDSPAFDPVSDASAALDATGSNLDAASKADVNHAPIDANKMIGALTDDEWGKLCDWEAYRLGGYGSRPDCDSNFAPMAPADQATCVGIVRITFECHLIVSDFEACIDERVENPCALTFPACEPIGKCHDPPDARPDGT